MKFLWQLLKYMPFTRNLVLEQQSITDFLPALSKFDKTIFQSFKQHVTLHTIKISKNNITSKNYTFLERAQNSEHIDIKNVPVIA